MKNIFLSNLIIRAKDVNSNNKDFKIGENYYKIGIETLCPRNRHNYEITSCKKAIFNFKRAIENDYKLPEVYLYLGIAKSLAYSFKGSNFYGSGLKEITYATRIKPDFAEAYLERGNAKMRIKRYNGALKDYDRAINIDPLLKEAYAIRSGARSEFGDYAGAIADITIQIGFYPNYKKLFEDRSKLFEKIGDYKSAIDDYSFLIEQSKYLAPSYYEKRGDAKFMIQEYKGAIEDYSKVIEIEESKTLLDRIYRKRGSARVHIGDNNEGIEDCSKSIEINSQSAKAYNFRGIARFYIGDDNDAISDLTTAIELDKEYVSAYYNRSIVHKKLENIDAANEDLKISNEYSRIEIIRKLNWIEKIIDKTNGLIIFRITYSIVVIIAIFLIILSLKLDSKFLMYLLFLIGAIPLLCIMPVINIIDDYENEKLKLYNRQQNIQRQNQP